MPTLPDFLNRICDAIVSASAPSAADPVSGALLAGIVFAALAVIMFGKLVISK